jgi:sigma-54 dependent transcriptional regulator, flagellar regulatory protein
MTVSARKRAVSTVSDDLIIGSSPAIIALRSMIARVAASDASVLIAGPSGAGKELVARAIHEASHRAPKPFVALNCGAIPGELIESELFGHERGSFTGAHARRIGRFEEANSGTLFLDEIGDMRFDMQVKLLRVLEDRKVSRVGGSAPLPVDVRIISATHQDIEGAIADSKFREDLFFRLAVVVLRVPCLAERVSDIPELIAHFQADKPLAHSVRFDRGGMAQLMAHNWPGNVRELRNIVERAGVLHGGQTLGADDVALLLGRTKTVLTIVENLAPIAAPIAPASPAIPINLKDLLETMELERIQSALDMADGVISQAARMLTLKRTTLIEKMRKYGVQNA